MSRLTPWLQLMLAEIARKHEESERARAETVVPDPSPVAGAPAAMPDRSAPARAD